MANQYYNLLQIVNRAQAELGLPQSATVIGNTDATTTQMLALVNRVLDEMVNYKEDGWTALQFEYNLIINPPIRTTGDLTTPFSNIIGNIPSTAGILAGYMTCDGTNTIQGTRVAQVIDIHTVQLNMEATNTIPITGATYNFAQDTYPEPPGFNYFVNRSMWDRTNRWELIGPDSPQIDQWHRSGIVSLGPRRHFRQVGPGIQGTGPWTTEFSDEFGPTGGVNNFRIWPSPSELTVPYQFVFEYSSLNSIVLNGQIFNPTYAQTFQNDTDFSLLDAQALIMGLKWMFWEIKGMGSYVTLQNRWIDYMDRLVGRDGAAPTLQIAKRVSPIFLSPSNVQDGFFPGPSGQSGI